MPSPSALPMTQKLTAEQVMSLLHENLGAAVSIMDREFNLRYVNVGFAQGFDENPQALVGRNIRDVYSDSDFAEFSPHLYRALSGETVSYERVGRLRQRRAIWRTVSLSPWRDAGGGVAGIVMSSLAVHELMVATDSLRAANERLSSHMDNSPLTVFEFDADLRVTRVSSRVQELLGMQPSEVVGHGLWAVVGQEPQSEDLRAAFARLQSGEETSNRVVSTHRRADGAKVFCEWFNSALMGVDGQVSSLMCLVEDRTLRVLAESQLRVLAMTDQLTGLPNRTAFIEKLKGSLTRAVRSRQAVVLLFIDLDGFKSVNDNFGHASGDEVLREVARRLQSAIRDSDAVCRMGGDEFVVLLDTEVQEATAERMCKRILAVLGPPCVFSNGQAYVGASIGVARQPPLFVQPHELLQRADAAMYEAKRAGKGRVSFAT